MTMATRRVLVVDDDKGVRHALARVLQGYQLYFASCPRVALQFLEREPVDLLLADHAMPGMTGLELVKIAKARHPQVLRMMLTGQADMSLALEAINQGEIYRFLLKPWDELELKLELYFAFEHLHLMRSNQKALERSVLQTHPPIRTHRGPFLGPTGGSRRIKV